MTETERMRPQSASGSREGTRARGIRLLVLTLAVLHPVAARADILVFTTGRTMSVTSVSPDGDRLSVTLRDGGSAAIPASLISRIEPDEVPPASAEVEADLAPGGGPGAAAKTALSTRPFAALIASAAASHGVDLHLVHAVIETESNYQPRARSSKGAKGLMQLMPETARQYAVRDPYDPRANVDAGVKHLKDLLSRFDLRLALAAYNAGQTAVERFGGVPPYPETRNYVARVLSRIAP
jgi:hypothetical protein